MDANGHSPSSTRSAPIRQSSLNELLAHLRSNPSSRAFHAAPRRPSLAAPISTARASYGNSAMYRAINLSGRPEPRHASLAFLARSPPAEAASPPFLSSPAVPSTSAASESSSPRRRRSQRLAANTTTARSSGSLHAAKESTTPDNRKRKGRSPSPSRRLRATRKKPPPTHVKAEPVEDQKPAAKDDIDAESGKAHETCCICMSEPVKEEVSSINGCDHLFCFDCIGKWADRENTCPLCKSRFTSIARVHKAKRRKGGKHIPNSKRVKQRDQHSDVISGPAIEAMLASIAAAGHGSHSRLGHFLVALGSRHAPTLMASSHRATLILEDDIFADEADDNDLNMINFSDYMRATRQNRRSVAPGTFGMHFGSAHSPFGASAVPLPPARTYASNQHERNAGSSSNPLEIDLDDADDDDSVQVLRTGSSA